MKFATILCGFCGMKCYHVEKSPLQVFHLGNCRRLHLEETSPAASQETSPLFQPLRFLKGENCLHFHVCSLYVVSHGKEIFVTSIKHVSIKETQDLGLSKHSPYLSDIKGNNKTYLKTVSDRRDSIQLF